MAKKETKSARDDSVATFFAEVYNETITKSTKRKHNRASWKNKQLS